MTLVKNHMNAFAIFFTIFVTIREELYHPPDAINRKEDNARQDKKLKDNGKQKSIRQNMTWYDKIGALSIIGFCSSEWLFVE